MRRYWIWGLALYILIRWALLVQPGYVYDTAAYKRWALNAAHNGISQVYHTSDMDYPPLYAYILAPLAKLYLWLNPETAEGIRDTPLLTALVKLPPLLFDLGIALILFLLARALAGSSRGKGIFSRLARDWPSSGSATSGSAVSGSGISGSTLSASWTWILPALYLLQPAVVFSHGYWGQADSVHSFFVLASFLWLAGSGRGLSWPAWILLALATAMKPLGATFFPLLFLLTLLRHGPGAVLLGMAAAAVTGLAVLSPFLAAGQGVEVMRRILGDVQLMGYTSTNAHNFWWIYGPWQDADSPRYGPISLTHIGLFFFGLLYLGLVWKSRTLHRSRPDGLSPAQVLVLVCAVGAGFFMLSTHMHENHLFIAIPVLIPLAPFGRAWRWLLAVAGLGVFLNLIMHDLSIPQNWPFNLGGPSGVSNIHLQTIDVNRTYFVGELVGIWTGVAVNVAFFGTLLYAVFAPGDRSPLARLGRIKS